MPLWFGTMHRMAFGDEGSARTYEQFRIGALQALDPFGPHEFSWFWHHWGDFRRYDDLRGDDHVSRSTNSGTGGRATAAGFEMMSPKRSASESALRMTVWVLRIVLAASGPPLRPPVSASSP